MGVVTAVEDETAALGFALRDSPFGEELQRVHPWSDQREPDGLGQFENNRAPALHRTFFGVEVAGMSGYQLSDSEADYVQWAAGPALQAMGAVTSRLWGDISGPAREAVLDEDDLGPLHSRYLPAGREPAAQEAEQALKQLTDAAVLGALDRLAEAVQQTACYHTCLQLTAGLGRKEVRKLRRQGNHVADCLDEAGERAPNLYEATALLKQALRAGYEPANRQTRDLVAAVWACNELINAILWVALGIAEDPFEPLLFDQLPDATRLSGAGRHQDIALCNGRSDGFRLHPLVPFALQADTPADGLYFVTKQQGQIIGEPLYDIDGRRLAGLEAAP